MREVRRVLALILLVLPCSAEQAAGALRSKNEPQAPGLGEASVFPNGKFDPAISPDGSQIVFTWNGEKADNYDIYVSKLCRWTVASCEGKPETPLRLTANPAADFGPAWSPDGQHIAFCRRAQEGVLILLLPARGGPERKLGESAVGRPRLAWSPNGKSLAIVDTASSKDSPAIFLLSIGDGRKQKLTTPSVGTACDDAPSFSPDGRTLAFSRTPKNGPAAVYLQRLTDGFTPAGQPQRLSTAVEARGPINGLGWTPDGGSIILASGGLWKIPIAGGPSVRLAQGEGEIKSLSVSRQEGRLIYAELAPEVEIWRTAGPASRPEEIPPARLLASPDEDGSPNVSRDGKNITFSSTRSGIWEQWVCDSNGRNLRQLTFFGDTATGSARWSPDGRYIAFDGLKAGRYDVYVIGSNGSTVRPLTSEPSNDIKPSWSHDGRWIYFASDRGGDFQVYKIPFEGGRARQITKGGGYTSFESPDGRLLYYSKGRRDSSLWRVAVDGGEETRVLEGVGIGKWIVTNLGICILNTDAKPRPLIEFYRFSPHQRTQLPVLPERGKIWPAGTAVGASWDGRWLVYTQEGQITSHIRLLDY